MQVQKIQQVDPAIPSLNNPSFIYNFTSVSVYTGGISPVYTGGISKVVNKQMIVCDRLAESTYRVL